MGEHKRASIWTVQNFLALAFTAALGGVIFLGVGNHNPGAITAVHQAVPELAGSAGCVRCHGEGGQPMHAACNTCHEDVAAQLRARTGLHGRLAPAAARDCGRCHQEHRGAEFQQVGERAFQLATGAPQADYHHQGIQFDLHGSHDGLACDKCHHDASAAVLPRGCKRFLGLGQDCARCHEDPHDGQMTNCTACHGQSEPFLTVSAFQHDTRFPLVGVHGEQQCRGCHRTATPTSVEALHTRPDPTQLGVRTCSACHGSPHPETMIQRAALQGGVAESESCGLCHRDSHRDGFLVLDEAANRRLHAASGFPLAKPHSGVECQKCHLGIGTRAPVEPVATRHAARFPGRDAQQCAACHADPHGGQFSERGRSDCRRCHDAHRFAPAVFDLGAHARTAFPLTGAHQAVGCRSCHHTVRPGAKVGESIRTFKGTPKACAGCHVDVHDGAFDRKGRPVRVGDRTGCARCHGTASFRIESREFDHARWTGYALRGKHGSATCAQCHPKSAPSHGGTRRFARASSKCAACHADPHAGQFQRQGRTDCARCHDDSKSFAQTTFDHGRDSRFALDRDHTGLACAKCHKTYQKPGQKPVVRYRPLGRTCADCHGWDRPPNEVRKSRASGGKR